MWSAYDAAEHTNKEQIMSKVFHGDQPCTCTEQTSANEQDFLYNRNVLKYTEALILQG